VPPYNPLNDATVRNFRHGRRPGLWPVSADVGQDSVEPRVSVVQLNVALDKAYPVGG
jgi:hypothetical protein